MRLRNFILLCCVTVVVGLDGVTHMNDDLGTTEAQVNEQADSVQAKEKRYWPYDATTFGYGSTSPAEYTDFALTGGSYGYLYLQDSGYYVCAYGFNYRIGNIVCKRLGYGSVTNIYDYNYSYYTPKLACNWPYNNITDCFWGGGCPISRRVYIVCQDITTVASETSNAVNTTIQPPEYSNIGLTYGSNGFLYSYTLGSYVCSYGFDYYRAEMICRSFGYGSLRFYHTDTYHTSYTPRLACRWPYNNITDCYWTGDRCPSYSRIHIGCQEQTTVALETSTFSDNTNETTTTPVRLVGGTYGWEGRVEVYHNGEWGTVCDDGFGRPEATVVCRMLGYHMSVPMYYSSRIYGYGRVSIFLDELRCSGYETDINDCRTKPWGRNNCSHTQDIAVSCYGSPSHNVHGTPSTFATPIRLSNGYTGRVEVYHNGIWGTVCDDSFDQNDAIVVCGMLGFFDRYRVTYQSNYGGGSGPIWMDDVNCNGFESDIASCQFGSWGHHNCGHGEDVGVSCLDDFSTTETTSTSESWTTELGPNIPVKLVNGQQVQVYHNGVWGAICMNGFGWNEANTICRQLGYRNANGYSLVGSTGSPSTYTIWLDNLQCPSYAYSLSSCSASSWGSHGCSVYNSITLTCNGYSTTTSKYRTTTRMYCNRYNNPCHNGGTCQDEYYGATCYCHTGYTGRYCETLTVENEVNVQCLENSWQIRLYIPSLHQAYSDFRNGDIYLGRDNCPGRQVGNYLIFTQDYTECGTSEVTTSDKIIYSNELVYAVHDPHYHFITKEYRFRLKTDCYISRNEGGSNQLYHNYPVTESEHHVTNSGHHYVHLAFYSDPQFTHLKPLYGSKVGDNVYVRAYTDVRNYNIKMRLDDCYTKPTRYGSDAYRFYLLRDGCPIDPSVHVLSESTHETRFDFQEFEYVTNHDSLYIFCNASFCDSGDYSPSCERNCAHKRKDIIQASLRSGPFETNEVVDIVRNNTKKGIGYMTVLDPSPPDGRVVQSPTLIAVTAVCVAIVFSVCGVLIYRKRRFVRPSKQDGANASVLHF